MDPDTGKFYQETPEMAATNPIPQSWPRFQLGEHFDVGGIRMRLDRIYDDGIRVRIIAGAGVAKGQRKKRIGSIKRHPATQKFHVGQTVTVGQVQMSIESIGADSLVLKPYKMEEIALRKRMAEKVRRNLRKVLRQRVSA